MSTNSYIGIENEDGSVLYAYCHWDGYPDGVGAAIEHLDREHARMLVEGGDMSTPWEHYHTNRGEPWDQVKPNTAADRHEYLDLDIDYKYMIDLDGRWRYAGGRDPHWRML